MNKTFIDTSFSISLVSEIDEHHARAVELSLMFENFRWLRQIVFCWKSGILWPEIFASKPSRQLIISFSPTKSNLSDYRHLFEKAFDLYQAHRDKTWGLVDCVSFIVMKELRIAEALTNDKHFQQAGFKALMRDD